MKALFHLAKDIQQIFTKQGWRFCFIGGIALQRWGEPRLTRDVDISLLTGFGDEEKYVDFLTDRFPSRIENAREFALNNRVLLLKSQRNIPIDIALSGLPFEETAIIRSTDFPFLKDVTLRTCSAEDLIIYKAFADRTRDWADIEGILIRQKNNPDWDYIEKHPRPLCELKESPHIIQKLQSMQSRIFS